MWSYYLLILLIGTLIDLSEVHAKNVPNIADSLVDNTGNHVNNKQSNPPSQASRILKGKPSLERDYRYQVAIMHLVNNSPVLKCGGAIIHRRYILTAAHCVYKYRSNELIVRHGGVCGTNPMTPHNEPRTFHKVAKTFMLRQYSSAHCRRHQNDIAIIKVQEAFDLSDTARYAKVNLPEYYGDYEGYNAIVTGYGPDYGPLTENVDPTKPRYLQYVIQLRSMSTTVISNEQCQYESDVVLTEGNLCAQAHDPESQTCFEDDGGPLVHDNTIIGILNDRKCDFKNPEMFTRVSSYLHFIKTILEHQPSYDVLII